MRSWRNLKKEKALKKKKNFEEKIWKELKKKFGFFFAQTKQSYF